MITKEKSPRNPKREKYNEIKHTHVFKFMRRQIMIDNFHILKNPKMIVYWYKCLDCGYWKVI
jgi:hypothetical protein